MAVQPLAPREGRAVDGPYEGLPPHLQLKIIHWLRRYLHVPQGAPRLRTQSRTSWTHWHSACASHLAPQPPLGEQILTACTDDEEYCLDVIHLILQLEPTRVDYLERCSPLEAQHGQRPTPVSTGESTQRQCPLSNAQANQQTSQVGS